MEDELELPAKRSASFWATRGKRAGLADFWATRGKKESDQGKLFWATRGKRAGAADFWAVRG